MKILLAAVNAKYIHSNLAVYSLSAYAKRHMRCDENTAEAGIWTNHEISRRGGNEAGEGSGSERGVEIEIAEYTINQQTDDILRDIYERRAQVVCFSCYIWNLTYVEALTHDLGKICPDMHIWLGGPEVSYDAKKVFMRLENVKGVMMGEGEKTFCELCKAYARIEKYNGESCKAYARVEKNDGESCKAEASEKSERVKQKESLFERIAGITFRRADGKIQENPWREPMDLSEVPFVYEDLSKFEHKIIYYETSRGCPFSCSYCLSSIDKRLRFRSLDLVKKELRFFLDKKVAQVKFVDRTFNCKHSHAMAVWSYIKEHDNGITNFHFEVSADLLNEEELALIETMRPGLIQLEIGVQSTNPDTIREIRRTMDFSRLSEIVTRIEKMKNVHQHLDLIAGLPYEDLESFRQSFDDVYALKPHQLQLGFLKVLKGSYMEEKQSDYDLIYKSAPPYEVLGTKWLSYEEILELKGIEEMVEVYYNSRQFEHTLEALEQEFASAYQMYFELWKYYKSENLLGVQHKRSARYGILLDFIRNIERPGAESIKSGIETEQSVGREISASTEKEQYYREFLIYDYYLRENAKTRPPFAGENALGKESSRRFYEREAQTHEYLPGYSDYDKNQMRKMTHLEYFPMLGKTVLFDYMERNPINQEARNVVVREVDMENIDL